MSWELCEPLGELLSVGHSTHGLDELVALLHRHGVSLLADVRTVPRSRRTPWSAAEVLAGELPIRGIAYEHLRELGGWRRPHAGSTNDGWSNDAFRGYADHMATDEFAHGLARLEALGRARRTAMMCAEGLWWRCHRRLVADALVVRGWRVTHILPDGHAAPHELTSFAVQQGGRLTYPAGQLHLEAEG